MGQACFLPEFDRFQKENCASAVITVGLEDGQQSGDHKKQGLEAPTDVKEFIIDICRNNDKGALKTHHITAGEASIIVLPVASHANFLTQWTQFEAFDVLGNKDIDLGLIQVN